MKRVWIAGALMLLCAAFCLISFFTVTKDCNHLIAHAKQIKSFVQNEDERQVKQTARQIKKEWNSDAFSFSLLTSHIHYDTLEECTDKVYHACMAGETKEIRNACDDLIFEASHIIESIRPRAENVF
ncbi:MAG: DUF4363 family protein [Clostridia bacterium]|nr:DUF4363 family protein [Clostridia bacterium]